MMNLKTNKNFIKKPRLKIKNNKNQSWNTNNKKDHVVILGENREKNGKKK
jgi:hypothetical protein